MMKLPKRAVGIICRRVLACCSTRSCDAASSALTIHPFAWQPLCWTIMCCNTCLHDTQSAFLATKARCARLDAQLATRPVLQETTAQPAPRAGLATTAASAWICGALSCLHIARPALLAACSTAAMPTAASALPALIPVPAAPQPGQCGTRSN